VKPKAVGDMAEDRQLLRYQGLCRPGLTSWSTHWAPIKVTTQATTTSSQARTLALLWWRASFLPTTLSPPLISSALWNLGFATKEVSSLTI